MSDAKCSKCGGYSSEPGGGLTTDRAGNYLCVKCFLGPEQEGPPTLLRECRICLDKIDLLSGKAMSQRESKEVQDTAIRMIFLLSNEALELDEKRRAALETDVKVKNLRIQKLKEALNRLKKEYDPGEGCDNCGTVDVHDCFGNCPWRQAAEAFHCSDDELLDALTPVPQDSSPNVPRAKE